MPRLHTHFGSLCVLSLLYLAALSGCDGDSTNTAPTPDSTISSNDDTADTPGNDVDSGSGDDRLPSPHITPATRKLLAEGFNAPQAEPAHWAVFSLDLDESLKDNYFETMTLIRESFGGYMNWNYMVLNHEGSDAVNAPIMERLVELKYNGWEGGYTTEELVQVSSCLGGAHPNGMERDADYEAHSTCMAWKGFLEESHGLFDPNYRPEPWLIPLEALTQSIQHEYFHHYQRAHALDRGLDYQYNPESPDTTVNAPWWWIEGAAMASEMWWLRGAWSKLSYLQDEPRVGAYIEERLAYDRQSFWFFVQRIQKAPPITEPNGFVNNDIADCSGWRLSEEHSDGYPHGDDGAQCEWDLAPFAPVRFMAHKSSWQAVLRDIPAAYFELGFWGAVERYTGLDEASFYDEFNALMRATRWEDIDPSFAPSGWNTPDEAIESHVDFLGIQPYVIP